jgi:hypothetical protein
MMSEEEIIWKQSLRCSWITACETIANFYQILICNFSLYYKIIKILIHI